MFIYGCWENAGKENELEFFNLGDPVKYKVLQFILRFLNPIGLLFVDEKM